MSQKTWRHLFADLSNILSLEGLELVSIEVEDAMLKLENNKGLQWVNLTDVRMSKESWEHFFGAIEGLPRLSKLYLIDSNIGTSMIKLPKSLKELRVIKLILTEAALRFSLNVLKSLNPQSEEIEDINIFLDTDKYKYKYGRIYIRSHKYSAKFKMVNMLFERLC